jgi:signal transduction histidine kinase
MDSSPQRRDHLAAATRSDVGLHLKLAMAGSISVFLCVALLSAILLYRQSSVLGIEITRAAKQQQRAMIDRGQLLAQNMARGMETAIAGYDFAFIADTVQTMQRDNEDLDYALVTNGAGVVIIHTDTNLIGARLPEPPAEAKPKLIRREGDSDVIEITQPLSVSGREWGWLVLGFDMDPIREEANAAYSRGQQVLARSTTLAVFVALLVALLGLAASVWTSRRLLRPVVQLAEDAAIIAEGNLDHEIPATESSDEIGLLARQFEAMRRAIRRHVGELVVAKQEAEAATYQEKKLRAEIEQHSRLLETKVRERTADLIGINERLTEYDRLKSEFLSNVSHELRTPLAAIFSAAKIINRYGGENSKANARFSNVIMEETDRLTRLINDLLDLSKIEAGRAEWNITKVPSPEEILTHVVTAFRPLYAEAGIELDLEYQNPLPVIEADRDRLTQVLTNLCDNARKFTPSGGSVIIRADSHQSQGETWLRIQVTDTGCGIPDDERQLVFERFRQGSRNDRPQGTGLGLTICQEVVERHGGTIRAEAPSEGGTRIVILLPIAATRALNAQPGS